jgi:gamma-glutamylcyclotransferase (GGCT)/AIG2-like uncharacterized protein YtfP
MLAYFAYGANMSRAGMAARCPTAEPVGVAALDGWTFVITRAGYASIMPARGRSVYGVLWRLRPRDIAALDAYESVPSGLYRRRTLTVRCKGHTHAALVYLGTAGAFGRPRPGYLEAVIAAAREWRLPKRHIGMLERLLPSGLRAALPADVGELSSA